jgi:RNA dependent RNA polymerase/RNA helicase-like protein
MLNKRNIRKSINKFVIESAEPLKNTVSQITSEGKISKTNADIALSEDVPRTNEIFNSKIICKNWKKEEDTYTKDNKYPIKWILLYPLCNRMQNVSKDTFAKLEGKVIIKKNIKYRIIYPPNYPKEKHVNALKIKQCIQGFKSESLLGAIAGAKKLFNQIGSLLDFIVRAGEVTTAIKEKGKTFLIRICSILTRFLKLATSDNLDIIPFLCLIADAYALKEDFCDVEYERFNGEALEDILVSSVLGMLPNQFKTIALALIAIQRRDTLISPSYLQTIVDVLRNLLDFISVYVNIPMITTLIENTKNLLGQFSSYSIISECTNHLLEYQRSPIRLNQPEFWNQIDATFEKIDGLTAGTAGMEALDIARLHPALKQRIEAFLNLKKLKDQVQKASRLEPSAFVFDGPPGLLKSVTLTKVLKLLDKSVYVHHVKSMMDGKDFYDLYANQQVFYMDDVGQQGKSQWRNLINWVSCVPLPLDCATASLKNTKLFNSEIIMLTTNQFMGLHGFTNQDGVSDPKALFRRAFVFDWSGLKLEDALGNPCLKGIITIKKYDTLRDRWDVFNLKDLKGTLVVTEENDLLSWITSWILTISEWKKACKDRNEISEERKQIIKQKIVVADFAPEMLSIAAYANNETTDSDFDSDEDFEDASSVGPIFFKSVPLDNVNTLSANMPYSSVGNFTSAEQIFLHANIEIEDPEIDIGEDPKYNGVGRLFTNMDPRNMDIINLKIKEWSLLDHFKIMSKIAFNLLSKTLTTLFGAIISFISNPKNKTLLLAIICFFLMLWGIWTCTTKFEGQTSLKEIDHWEDLKKILDSSCSSQINALERNHVKEITLEENGIKMCCFCFDRYILIPSHALFSSKQYQTVSLKDVKNNNILLVSVLCEVIYQSNSEDIAILKLPSNHALTFKDAKFNTEGENSTHLVTPVGAIKTQNIKSTASLGDIPYAMTGNKHFSNIIKPCDRELYTVHFRGLCGSVLATQQGRIMGMHVAGSDKESLGVSLIWSKSLCVFLESLPRMNNMPGSILLHEKQDQNSSCARVESFGYAAVPEKTRIMPSPLYGSYPVTRSPANLTKYGYETVKQIFSKSTNQVIQPPAEEILFGKEVLEDLLPDFGDITDKQVIKGYEGIAPMKKDTSNGFKCKKLKQDYINFEEGIPKDFFIKELKDWEDNIKLNNPKDNEKFVWFETLKDEVRNNEKEGEPRSFRVSTVHQQFWTKKLTAELVSKTLVDRKNNQIMIGCNPIVEWPSMASILQKGNIFAGDIGKWDGAMLPSVQQALNEVILSKYKGDHREMLAAILQNLMNSIVLVQGRMYIMTHSMPSGSFLTAFYNSLVNRFYTAMWYKRHTPEALVATFNNEVVDYVYGDDKVVGVKTSRTNLNAVTMLEFFKSIGMNFTDANKQPISIPYQTLDQISFLKRDFVYHADLGRIVCPLSLNTLQNTISWVDTTKELDVVMDGKIGAVYRELYLHPNYKDLMMNFRLIVQEAYPDFRWLSYESLKTLYNRNPEQFLIDSSKFFSYE